jgi:Putative transposase
MMRPPVSLSRLRFTPGSHEVVYAGKGGHDEPELTEDERIDAMDLVARVLVQIPDPRRHSVRSYGFYSNGGARIPANLDNSPCPGAASSI